MLGCSTGCYATVALATESCSTEGETRVSEQLLWRHCRGWEDSLQKLVVREARLAPCSPGG